MTVGELSTSVSTIFSIPNDARLLHCAKHSHSVIRNRTKRNPTHNLFDEVSVDLTWYFYQRMEGIASESIKNGEFSNKYLDDIPKDIRVTLNGWRLFTG